MLYSMHLCAIVYIRYLHKTQPKTDSTRCSLFFSSRWCYKRNVVVISSVCFFRILFAFFFFVLRSDSLRSFICFVFTKYAIFTIRAECRRMNLENFSKLIYDFFHAILLYSLRFGHRNNVCFLCYTYVCLQFIYIYEILITVLLCHTDLESLKALWHVLRFRKFDRPPRDEEKEAGARGRQAGEVATAAASLHNS